MTRVQAASLAVFFLLVFSRATAAADDWAAPTRAFEKKIAEKLKPGQSVTLSLQNLSSLSMDDAAVVQKDLETELRAQGWRVKANGKKTAAARDEGVAEIRVTLAENSQGLLWVAEIERGEDREVVMQAVPRAASVESSERPPAMFLQSQMIFAQETPILDFALIELPAGSAKQLLMLEPARVALYAPDQGRWRVAQVAALLPLDSPQRDLHGWFSIAQDSFRATLPGEICGGVLRDTLALKCEIRTRQPGDEPGGDISPAVPDELRRADPFYSRARIEVKGAQVQIDAGIDGIARLYRSNDAKGPIATFHGWGSELAAVKTGCGNGWQILVTRASDSTERDAVQAIEIADKKAVPASPPIEFAGPVMALHASPDKDEAFAVVWNRQTGQYEAHVLSLSCGH